MATRRRARRRPWNRARRRAVGWERPVCARRASVALASRGDPAEKVSGAELGANPDLGGGWAAPGREDAGPRLPCSVCELRGPSWGRAGLGRVS